VGDEVRINDNTSKLSKISKTDHGDNDSLSHDIGEDEVNQDNDYMKVVENKVSI